jgi:hypothetical protein
LQSFQGFLQKNSLIPSKIYDFSGKTSSVVSETGAEINGRFRDVVIIIGCIVIIFYSSSCPWCFPQASVLTVEIVQASREVQNILPTLAEVFKLKHFQNHRHLFFNILHIYFVLLYNFMNYLQLRYLFFFLLFTTEIRLENKFSVVSLLSRQLIDVKWT